MDDTIIRSYVHWLEKERVEALRQTMIEARHIASAAEQDYLFCKEACERRLELGLWAVQRGLSFLYSHDGLWRVVGFHYLQGEATIAEALLRAWRAEQIRKLEVTIHVTADRPALSLGGSDGS